MQILLCEICLKAASGDNTWTYINSGKFSVVHPHHTRSPVANITLMPDCVPIKAVLIYLNCLEVN